MGQNCAAVLSGYIGEIQCVCSFLSPSCFWFGCFLDWNDNGEGVRGTESRRIFSFYFFHCIIFMRLTDVFGMKLVQSDNKMFGKSIVTRDQFYREEICRFKLEKGEPRNKRKEAIGAYCVLGRVYVLAVGLGRSTGQREFFLVAQSFRWSTLKSKIITYNTRVGKDGGGRRVRTISILLRQIVWSKYMYKRASAFLVVPMQCAVKTLA